MYVYIDESGNSGVNNFDDAQPYLYSLAITSDRDLDVCIDSNVRKICDRLDISTLHANELGLSKIDSVSSELRDIISINLIDFHFVAIEKKYIAVTKLFETIFNPNENPSVPFTSYKFIPLRNLLFMFFLKALDHDIVDFFWKGCMLEKHRDKASLNFVKVCKIILSKTLSIKDARAREIIEISLNWAALYPNGILYYIESKHVRNMLSANFLAFTLLIRNLSNTAKEKKQKIDFIIHHDQEQFGLIFQSYYETLKKNPTIHPEYIETHDIDSHALIGSRFEMKSSTSSCALQITDVALYMLKKYHEGIEFVGNAGYLMEYILKRCHAQEINFKNIFEMSRNEYARIMSAQFSAEDEAHGKVFMNLVEERRQKAMDEYLSRQHNETTQKSTPPPPSSHPNPPDGGDGAD